MVYTCCLPTRRTIWNGSRRIGHDAGRQIHARQYKAPVFSYDSSSDIPAHERPDRAGDRTSVSVSESADGKQPVGTGFLPKGTGFHRKFRVDSRKTAAGQTNLCNRQKITCMVTERWRKGENMKALRITVDTVRLFCMAIRYRRERLEEEAL